MRARRRGVHEIVIQLTSLEIKQFFLHEKTDARPRKFVLQLLKHSVLKKLILRLNNYTTILAYVLLIEPIKGRVVFY